jgi:erythromycin esterase
MIRPLLIGVALLISTLSVGPPSAAAQRPLNLDFERVSVSYPDRPWGWTFGWSAFGTAPAATFTLDTVVVRAGLRSLRIVAPESATAVAPHTIMVQLPPEVGRGRQVQLAAWVRTNGAGARAMLTIEAWKDRAFAAADTAWSDAGSPDTAWTRHEARIRVPTDSTIHSLVITVGLAGRDTAWFDDLSLAVDGLRLETVPTAVAPATAPDLQWLRRHASPIHRVDVTPSRTGDAADLRAIRDIVGAARIVGLGESTHGTREFFQMKHRVLEYLVRVHGFRVFAIEANQLAVERVNAFVRGASGTARDAMRVMFRVWNTEEMRDLIDWMRAHNAGHPQASVRFVGYDMQDHRTPSDTLRAFLDRTEPALLGRFDALSREYRAQQRSATPEVADTVRARWAAHADTLWNLVRGRRTAWLASARTPGDTLAAEWAVQSANLLRQAARFNVALSSPERDSLMAANLDWVLRVLAPHQRAVVWAHDVHVSHGGDPARSFNGGAQMGAYLRVLGHDYRSLTLLTYAGTYSATRSFTDHRMIEAEGFPAPPASVEEALHRLARPPGAVGWVVDLRAARAGGGGDWLRRPRPIRHIGYAAYDYGFEFTAVLPLEFDGIVFIDRTTASRLLP